MKDSRSKKKKGGAGGGGKVIESGYHSNTESCDITWSTQRGAAVAEDDDEPVELLTKPREYQVKFSFPNPPPLSPPILGAYGEY